MDKICDLAGTVHGLLRLAERDPDLVLDLVGLHRSDFDDDPDRAEAFLALRLKALALLLHRQIQ